MWGLTTGLLLTINLVPLIIISNRWLIVITRRRKMISLDPV